MEILIIVYGKDLFKQKKTIPSDIFEKSRPIAIQNYFNLTTYFSAWDGRWAPMANKNAYELFNNIHVINRDQI
jgi:hypothetical protein